MTDCQLLFAVGHNQQFYDVDPRLTSSLNVYDVHGASGSDRRAGLHVCGCDAVMKTLVRYLSAMDLNCPIVSTKISMPAR